MNQNVIQDPSKLTPGKWYACAFASMEDEAIIEWGNATIAKYEGDGYWSDESGEEVDSLWDPILQARVAMDAADAYAQQG